MARSRSRGGSTTWTTLLYLLLVFVAPLAFLGTAKAAEDQKPLQEYGTGKQQLTQDISVNTS